MQLPTKQIQSAVSEFYLKEQQKFKTKVGVFLVLMQGEHILFLRRAHTGIEDGQYVFPMGSVDEGETPLEALVRESFEEVGAIIKPKD